MGHGQIPGGSTPGQARPLALPVQTQIATSAVQVQLLAANASRRNATIQNLTSVPVSIYFTTGAGATAPFLLSQYQVLSLYQDGVGLWQGAVFAVSGSAGVVGVTEET